MPRLPFPTDPSLEHFRKQAKRLHAAVEAADPDAVARVREFHPRADTALSGFTLADAQLVLARAYGLPSWPRLVHHLEQLGSLVWTPPDEAGETPVDQLLRLACVDYQRWQTSHAAKARRLLAERPELARESIHATATVGDVEAARAFLAADARAATVPGGPHRWPPLLYACYSRLDSDDPGHSTLEVARLLLDAGADPDAGFLWHGNVPPFTALTGAFGEGENIRNQPPHRDRDALARLLLDAGADPNDGQTLYNRHFRVADDHLVLLFEYGLGKETHGPWFRRVGDRMGTARQMLVEELWAAARDDRMARVRLLVEHGTEVNTPGFRDGRTPYEVAALMGNQDVAEYLVAHGARRVALAPLEQFRAACIAGRAEDARALIAAHPDLIAQIGHDGRVELIQHAVDRDSAAGVRLMAELGFEIAGCTRNTPLHEAAWAGNLAMVRLLLELGADPNARDREFDGTPLGWANYNRQRHVVEYLVPLASIADAVQCDAVERVAELLEAEPELATALDHAGRPLAHLLHPGLHRLDEMLAVLVRHGVDLDARDRAGHTILDVAQRNGHEELADVLRRHGART